MDDENNFEKVMLKTIILMNNGILSHLFILNQEQYLNIGPTSRTNIWVLLLM